MLTIILRIAGYKTVDITLKLKTICYMEGLYALKCFIYFAFRCRMEMKTALKHMC